MILEGRDIKEISTSQLYMTTVIFLRNMKLRILKIKSETGNWNFHFI